MHCVFWGANLLNYVTKNGHDIHRRIKGGIVSVDTGIVLYL